MYCSLINYNFANLGLVETPIRVYEQDNEKNKLLYIIMGLRKKILAGFVGIAILLLFAGAASLFELESLSKSTQALIETSSKNMKATQMVLNAVHEQNADLLEMVILSDNLNHDSLISVSKEQLTAAFKLAAAIEKNQDELDVIFHAYSAYDRVVDSYHPENKEANIAWFVGVYKNAYLTFITTINDYMSDFQHSLAIKTTQLEKNAYRATTPNIITIAVLGIIIGMFLFFVDKYFIKPILDINKGLQNYLSNKTPFKVKVDSNDEIQSLKESVEKLILLYKNKKRE